MNAIVRRALLWVVSVLFLLANQAVLADVKLYADKDGLFIRGYDPVAYYVADVPIKGSTEFQLDFQNVRILFSSEKNKQAFLDNPKKFIPSYGGYCSYGIRSGRYSDSDPTTFEVVDGRLFLMFNKGTELIWLNDVDENIEVADKVWSDMVQ